MGKGKKQLKASQKELSAKLDITNQLLGYVIDLLKTLISLLMGQQKNVRREGLEETTTSASQMNNITVPIITRTEKEIPQEFPDFNLFPKNQTIRTAMVRVQNTKPEDLLLLLEGKHGQTLEKLAQEVRNRFTIYRFGPAFLGSLLEWMANEGYIKIELQ